MASFVFWYITTTCLALGLMCTRRLFDGSFWLDQTVLISQQRNAESRAALEQGGLRAGSTKLLLHIEHGRRPLLKPVRVGLREQGCAWPARSVSRPIRATPSKSRTWADMPPTFLRARTEALQTARPLCAVGPTFSDFTILDTEGMCC